MEFIECSALSKSNEVSLASLKSFQEILYNKPINSMKAAGNGDDDELWTVRILFILNSYSLKLNFKIIFTGCMESVAECWR